MKNGDLKKYLDEFPDDEEVLGSSRTAGNERLCGGA